MTAPLTAATGSCRVVNLNAERDWKVVRCWDVYCDEIGDFVATMRPSLPVADRKVAQRICDNLNARYAAQVLA